MSTMGEELEAASLLLAEMTRSAYTVKVSPLELDMMKVLLALAKALNKACEEVNELRLRYETEHNSNTSVC